MSVAKEAPMSAKSWFARQRPARRRPSTRCAGIGFLTLLLLATAGMSANAADGDPDPTFSGDGMRQIAIPDLIGDDVQVATDAQGSIFVAAIYDPSGDDGFVVTKLTPSGGNDTSFGILGQRLVSFPNQVVRMLGIFPQPDGKVMLLGTVWTGSRYRPAMARLTASGAIDTTFAVDGRLVLNTTPWGNPSFLVDAATRQADGKYLFAGVCAGCPVDDGTFFLRTSASGVPDPSFGNNGWSSVVWPASAEFKTLRVDGANRAVFAGDSGSGLNHKGLVLRVTASGALDTSFGAGSGFVQINSFTNSFASAIEIDSGNSITVALTTVENPDDPRQTGLLRLREDGSRETFYAGTGLRDLSLESGSAINALQRRSDGRMIAAGWIDHTGAANSVGKDFFIARVLPNGSLDTSLDGNGVQRIALSATRDAAEAMVLSAGKPVIAGFSYVGAERQLGVLRMQSDLIFSDGAE